MMGEGDEGGLGFWGGGCLLGDLKDFWLEVRLLLG